MYRTFAKKRTFILRATNASIARTGRNSDEAVIMYQSLTPGNGNNRKGTVQFMATVVTCGAEELTVKSTPKNIGSSSPIDPTHAEVQGPFMFGRRGAEFP